MISFVTFLISYQIYDKNVFLSVLIIHAIIKLVNSMSWWKYINITNINYDGF